MTIAHISDTHLGYRNYGKVTDTGFNQREVDVMECFCKALDSILTYEPDLVVHAGDLFDRVRPSNYSIVMAYQAIAEFQAKRGNRPFCLIAGNHETPRTHDIGSIISLFESIPGMVVIYSDRIDGARHEISELDLEILGVPTALLESKTLDSMEPTLRRKNSVLVLHGMERSVLPESADFSFPETHPERWSYVALGDYHIFKQFGDHCCYPGSTEYTSTDIWHEVREEKCWVHFDTESRALTRVPTHPRPVIDLPVIDASDMTGQEITEAMIGGAKWPIERSPVVRQVVIGVRNESRAEIDYPALQAIEDLCLAYVRDLRPAMVSRVRSAIDPLRTGRTLEEEWRVHMEEANLAPGVDRERVIEIGRKLLLEAATDEADFAPA